MTDHLAEMRRKITLLRELDAVAEHERRWEDGDEDPPYLTYVVLGIDDGADPVGDWPGGLGDWFRLAETASFGNLDMRLERQLCPQQVVDLLGEPIDDRQWLRIGDIAHEDAVLMDAATGEVIVYFDRYYKYGWSSPVVLRRPDVPSFIDTVALGEGHRELLGPTGDNPWWAGDPWYAYLRELGFVPAEHPDSQ